MLTSLICKSSPGPDLTGSRPPALLRSQLPKIYHNVILPFLAGLESKRFPTHFLPRNSVRFSRSVTLVTQSAFVKIETGICTGIDVTSSKQTT